MPEAARCARNEQNFMQSTRTFDQIWAWYAYSYEMLRTSSEIFCRQKAWLNRFVYFVYWDWGSVYIYSGKHREKGLMKLSATMSNYEQALSEQRQTSSCHPAQTIKEY